MPPQKPVAAEFDTSEFRRSGGPAEHNAATAWAAGRTGQGVTIAIVDTGVDADSPEFAGRISPLSKDILNAARDISGSDDHGTHVALVAAAARNGSGILGIAFDATLMVLRADDIGSCAADSRKGASAECSFSDSAIAAAIDYASINGAQVINISLGGEGATMEVRNAVAAAANRGALIVLSAGNDGAANPNSFATLLDTAANGGVIIVGSVDAEGTISDFSNHAGAQNNHYMTALGERICCEYDNGSLFVDAEGFAYLLSGTSYSTAQVSGAAALLAHAFPNLTGRQLADILLRSAFDVGAPGTDPIYGRGILDIARAFQPIGPTSLAGSGAYIALGDVTGAGSPAMGDALISASLPAIMLDEYQRAFQTDLAGTLHGAAPVDRLRTAVGTRQRTVSLASERISVAFAIDASASAEGPIVGNQRLRYKDETARVLAARIMTQLAPNLRMGFAYAERAHGLVAQLQGYEQPAFLVSPNAASDDGAFNLAQVSLALRRQLGPWGLTLSAEKGEATSSAVMQRAAEMAGRPLGRDVATYGIALDRRLDDVVASLGLSWMAEQRTLLGARFHDALGLRGADTLFLEARAGWDLTRGLRLGGGLRHGWTWAREGGLVAGSQLASAVWSFDLTRSGMFLADDTLAMRLSQPSRVERGALNLILPNTYSYDTLLTGYALRSLVLAPRGRELMAEIAWRGSVLSGDAAASLFYRRDPGHYEALPHDTGVALRWSKRF